MDEILELAMVAGWAAALVFYYAYMDESKKNKMLEKFYEELHLAKQPVAMAKLKPISVEEV